MQQLYALYFGDLKFELSLTNTWRLQQDEHIWLCWSNPMHAIKCMGDMHGSRACPFTSVTAGVGDNVHIKRAFTTSLHLNILSIRGTALSSFWNGSLPNTLRKIQQYSMNVNCPLIYLVLQISRPEANKFKLEQVNISVDEK
jgi:hypothetical protein